MLLEEFTRGRGIRLVSDGDLAIIELELPIFPDPVHPVSVVVPPIGRQILPVGLFPLA